MDTDTAQRFVDACCLTNPSAKCGNLDGSSIIDQDVCVKCIASACEAKAVLHLAKVEVKSA